MESDREWCTRVWNLIDAERGPVTHYLIRARFPGGRWRQVSRVMRASSADETYSALCREVASLSEPHVEVQAFTARARQPESTRAPWTASLSSDPSASVPDIDTDAEPMTVAMQFAAGARAGYEQERKALLELYGREVRHAREDAEHWKKLCFELAARQGPSALDVIERREQEQQVDHMPVVAQVIGGLQTVAGMVMAGLSSEGVPNAGALMLTAKTFFDSLTPQQVQSIANVLTTQQQAQLLLLAELAQGGAMQGQQQQEAGEVTVIDGHAAE